MYFLEIISLEAQNMMNLYSAFRASRTQYIQDRCSRFYLIVYMMFSYYTAPTRSNIINDIVDCLTACNSATNERQEHTLWTT